jgi:lipopolysaccharide transport system permease protein
MLLVFVPIFPGAFRLTPALLLVPVFLGLLVVLMVGIGLATSVLNVIYRDVAYLVNTALLVLYWLTPVIYPLDVIPQPYRSILAWNPLGGLLTALRGAIMHGRVPDVSAWVAIVVPTAVVLGIGWLIYRRNERLVLDYV